MQSCTSLRGNSSAAILTYSTILTASKSFSFAFGPLLWFACIGRLIQEAVVHEVKKLTEDNSRRKLVMPWLRVSFIFILTKHKSESRSFSIYKENTITEECFRINSQHAADFLLVCSANLLTYEMVCHWQIDFKKFYYKMGLICQLHDPRTHYGAI